MKKLRGYLLLERLAEQNLCGSLVLGHLRMYEEPVEAVFNVFTEAVGCLVLDTFPAVEAIQQRSIGHVR